jgi:hypothetical protein
MGKIMPLPRLCTPVSLNGPGWYHGKIVPDETILEFREPEAADIHFGGGGENSERAAANMSALRRQWPRLEVDGLGKVATQEPLLFAVYEKPPEYPPTRTAQEQSFSGTGLRSRSLIEVELDQISEPTFLHILEWNSLAPAAGYRPESRGFV